MLLDKYIFKELVKSQIVVLIVLIVIFAGQSVVRLMTQAAVGELPPRLIFLFMLYSLPEFLIFLFPLTLYVAIIITLGRICSDSEMVVMRSVGYSPIRVMFVSLFLAFFSALFVGYTSTILTPQAANARYELEQQASNNPEFLPIDSGRFVSLGSYSIYVENVANHGNEEKDISKIFVIEKTDPYGNETATITVAEEGHLVLDEDGVRWLVLKNGRRYETPKDGTFRKASFEHFRAPVSGNVTEETRERHAMERMTTPELLSSDVVRAQVEAQWRLSPIFATMVLGMIAVPLSMVNPRQGRFARLMPAILIYVAYYMFLLSIRNLILTDTVPLYPGMYIVPVMFLLLVGIPLNLPKSYLKLPGMRARFFGKKQGSTGNSTSNGNSNSTDNNNKTEQK